MPIECSTYAHSVDAGCERGHAMILLVSVRCERLYTRVSQGVSISVSIPLIGGLWSVCGVWV